MRKIQILTAVVMAAMFCFGGTAAAQAMIPQAQPGWFYSDADDYEFLVTNRIIQMENKDEFVKDVPRSGREKFIAVFVSTTHSEMGLKKAKETLKRGGFNDAVLERYDSTMVGMLLRVDPSKPEDLSYTVMSHQCLDTVGGVLYDWRGEDPRKASWTKAADSGQPQMFEKLWQKIRATRPDLG